MQPAEVAAGPVGARGDVPVAHDVSVSVSGWGGVGPVSMSVVSPVTLEQLREAVVARGPAIARGLGRSYGDAAQLRSGRALELTRIRAFELDAERGVLRAQAGVSLGALLAALGPSGWTLPVVPGTQHVTLGGAIASDIHGKNHGVAGTFGSHVLELEVLTASGELLRVSHGDDVHAATLGGMGLTGVIVSAAVKLRPSHSALVSVDTDRVESLDHTLSILDGPGGTHRVAWLHLLGRGLARGVVTRAEPLMIEGPGEPHGGMTVRSRLRVPARWPAGLLRRDSVRAFNELRIRRAPRLERGKLEPFGAHMFPLDALDAWPRLYGPSGFHQYQLVVPRGREYTLEELLIALRRSRVPCYLAVLKDFGPANEAPLSFPIAGWTLALDLPAEAPELETLLREFDELVAGAGGRVYLAKDARLRPDMVQAMYPRLAEWRSIRDRVDPERRWCSDLGLRTGLTEA